MNKIVYKIIDKTTGEYCGAYNRGYCTEYEFSSVSEARGSMYSGEYENKERYDVIAHEIRPLPTGDAKYKLTIIPALDVRMDSREFLFNTVEEMESAANTCASLLLFLQDDLHVMEDYSNAFFREILIDGEWVEVEEDDG